MSTRKTVLKNKQKGIETYQRKGDKEMSTEFTNIFNPELENLKCTHRDVRTGEIAYTVDNNGKCHCAICGTTWQDMIVDLADDYVENINENHSEPKKTYDPDQIDSVLDVVNDADPISMDIPVSDASVVENKHVIEEKPKMHKTTTNSFVKPSKKNKRKNRAKVVLGIVCCIAVYCINVVLTLIMSNFLIPVMSGILCKIAIATISSIVTIIGIAAYDYVAKSIN